MQDIQEHLEKLREQMADCERLRDTATDEGKRKLFSTIATHYKVLIDELERVIREGAPSDTFLGRKTYEPFPKEDDE